MSNFTGGLFLGCFGLFWCTFVFFVDGMLAWNAIRQVRASSYATTTGTITHSELKVTHNDGESYRPQVRYRYAVAGQQFDGERIRYDQATLGKGHSQAIVDRYSAGQAITVHYNQAAPQEAVLELGLETANLLGFLFLTPFNAVAFVFAGGVLAWLRAKLLGRPVVGISVRDDGLSQTIRIYNTSPMLVALIAWGATGFASVFAYLLLTWVLSFEATLVLGWCVTLAAAAIGWWRARKKYTEIRRDLLRSRLEVRASDGTSHSVAQEDLRPVKYSLRKTADSDGHRIERFPLRLDFFDPASQQEKSLTLPEQMTESAAKRFSAWLNDVLGVAT